MNKLKGLVPTTPKKSEIISLLNLGERKRDAMRIEDHYHYMRIK